MCALGWRHRVNVMSFVRIQAFRQLSLLSGETYATPDAVNGVIRVKEGQGIS